MEKSYTYFAGIIFIFIGIATILGFQIPNKIYSSVEITNSSAINFILIGISFLTIGFFQSSEPEKYTKCPRCKEVFNYNELEKEKCKYCKDIETIEVEEYYKKYPEELEEK